ncbi:MAG: DUF1801 domain-containing protein [Pseudomonadota bacterium]
MAKADNKTQITEADPRRFIAAVEPEKKRAEAEQLLAFFNRVTGLKPQMWGGSIIGYGRYHYKYESGREGEFMLTGFSPRKQNLSLHIMPGYRFGDMQDKLARLGKHKLGKSCLYINKLADVDLDVLEEIVRDGVTYMRGAYQTWDE